jgi:single-stranded-DNA-specific exonuclease RecJ
MMNHDKYKTKLFENLLVSRGLFNDDLDLLLCPKYEDLHDPMLLPDMEQAVNRLIEAHQAQESITIYGDYDADGITATALLLDALKSFGFTNLNYVLPDRSIDGYGLSLNTPTKLKKLKTTLLITVDCGSRDIEVIDKINLLGIDTIITDHHEVGDSLPNALAVVNPKRKDSQYPYGGLSGVGVAFKLVQTLQSKLPGLAQGQEKWLLDLVAIGTICDVMDMTGENRILVQYGLKVLAKTRRLGLKNLLNLAKVNVLELSTRSVGFQLGPRLNAAGRISDASLALDLLLSESNSESFAYATSLNDLNSRRKKLQDDSLSAIIHSTNDPVLVVFNENLHEGIIGIIAGRLLEEHHKPTFVFTLSEDDTLKGSARSFGDFSIADALKHAKDLVVKGGGHKEAGGLTISRDHLEQFSHMVNEYYLSLKLEHQEEYFSPKVDLTVSNLGDLNGDFYDDVRLLEPFGNGNSTPVFELDDIVVRRCDHLGTTGKHLKLTVEDRNKNNMKLLAFNAPEDWFLAPDDRVSICITIEQNEWNGVRNIEGKILEIKSCD